MVDRVRNACALSVVSAAGAYWVCCDFQVLPSIEAGASLAFPVERGGFGMTDTWVYADCAIVGRWCLVSNNIEIHVLATSRLICCTWTSNVTQKEYDVCT